MLNTNNITFFAETNFRDQRKRFGIKTADRRKHMYIIGKTGVGKSTVIEHMLVSDIQNGNGLCLIDPHGDLAARLLLYIPKSRINDVIYFNPADASYPIAFNVLEAQDQRQKHLVAAGLVSIFKKIWADSWGPRLEYILRNAILALLDYQGSTLLGVMRILTDAKFRERVISQIQDPVVKSFWQDEYSKYPDKFLPKVIAPIQNKVGQFLSNSLIRNIVGQTKSSFNLREVMDQKKIIILNLAKGKMGEDAAHLLGAMLITKLQVAAMSRIDTMEDERSDFYLYVDEFQNFATDSFIDILSEARKYRLNLVITHQYIGQLDPNIRSAILGNIGTLICFRIGSEDAKILEIEFSPHFKAEDLVNLGKYNICLKLSIDDLTSQPFTAKTLFPLPLQGYHEKIIKISRERYSKSKETVEKKILKWKGILDADLKKEKSLSIEKVQQKKQKQPQVKQQDKTLQIRALDKIKIPQPNSGYAAQDKKYRQKNKNALNFIKNQSSDHTHSPQAPEGKGKGAPDVLTSQEPTITEILKPQKGAIRTMPDDLKKSKKKLSAQATLPTEVPPGEVIEL